MERGFAVIGLGYVGLPVAIALAKRFEPVIGFDIAKERIAALRAGIDGTGEVGAAELAATRLILTDDPDRLAAASFFVVTVPTPIDRTRRPDLSALESACALIGPRLTAGAVVVFESTVYPGLTREVCGPLLARADQSRRPASSARDDRQNRCRRGRGDDEPHRGDLPAHRAGRDPSGALDRSRRGGKSHREHPARPQYRIDE